MGSINYGFLPIWIEGTHIENDELYLDVKIDKVYCRALDAINRIFESWIWEKSTQPGWWYIVEKVRGD